MKEIFKDTARGTLHWVVAAVMTIAIAGFTSWLIQGRNHDAGCNTKPCYLALEARIITLESRLAKLEPQTEMAAP